MRRKLNKVVNVQFVLFFIVLFSSWIGARAEITGVEAKTAHYDLYVEGMDPARAGKSVEALYSQLARFFGAEPHERLRVKIFENNARMTAALKADGVEEDRDSVLEGVYIASNKIAYVTPDARTWGDEAVLLHECTHQFHFLALHPSGLSPKSDFYIEGLAMHFETCVDDGSKSGIGKPLITLVDVAAAAQQDFDQRHDHSFRQLAVDPKAPNEFRDYGGAWGLVSFLLDVHPAEFNKWSSRLESLADPKDAWAGAFGDDRDAVLSMEYAQWLQSHQQVWISLAGQWSEPAPKTIDGYEDINTGICLLKQPIKTLSASVSRSDEKSGSAGIIFDFISDKSFRCVWVTPKGEIRGAIREGDNWTHQVVIANVADPGNFAVAIRPAKNQTNVLVDGRLAITEPSEGAGQCGFIVIQGAARFGSIEYGGQYP